ncbi:MAG TPA: hydroxyisourate hydrolase [Pseudonocardia sp.]|nr:hydroxyisourate hydrolase [Pseudonocardia sp.]
MTLSTHVLDAGRGLPAAGVPVALSRRDAEGWRRIGEGVTDADGRCRSLAPGALEPGAYRLAFDTGAYLPDGFYPEVAVAFRVTDPGRHHHVPLLLSPYSYSTYLGS